MAFQSGIYDCGVYKNLRVVYLFTDYKSIHNEAVSNVRENLQYLDVSIFTHILSSRYIMEETKGLKLSYIVEKVDDFLQGAITIEAFQEFLAGMNINSYIPIVTKVVQISKIINDFEYSNTNLNELKIAELNKNLFFCFLLQLYANVELDENIDLSFDLYDKLYPVLSDYILARCEKDYKQVLVMVNQSLDFYNMQNLFSIMSTFDADALREASAANREIIQDLTKNEQLIHELSQIAVGTDPAFRAANEVI